MQPCDKNTIDDCHDDHCHHQGSDDAAFRQDLEPQKQHDCERDVQAKNFGNQNNADTDQDWEKTFPVKFPERLRNHCSAHLTAAKSLKDAVEEKDDHNGRSHCGDQAAGYRSPSPDRQLRKSSHIPVKAQDQQDEGEARRRARFFL